MHATLGLTVVASVLAAVAATPYYPQTRQLYYPGLPQPQYTPYPLAAAPLPLPYRQLFYPQPNANYVAAPLPALRYPANTLPLAAAVPAKQAFYYPSPYPGNYVVAGDEEGSNQSWAEWLTSFYPYPSSPAEAAEQPAKPAEEAAGAAPSGEKGDKPAESEKPSNEKVEAAKPSEETKAIVKDGPQNYVLVGQPQFYGSYGLQRLNPAVVLPTANHGAVSSYLLLKNFPGVKYAPFPQVPQVPQAAPQQPAADADAELIPSGGPGSAALGYQKLLQAAQTGRQLKEYEDAISVDAVQRDSLPQDDKPAAESETEPEAEKESEDETGTSE